MSTQTPEGEPTESEDAEQSFRKVVRQYFQKSLTESTIADKASLQTQATNLAPTTAERIIKQVKKEEMHIPESMFMSKKAFRRMQEYWKSNFEFTHINHDELFGSAMESEVSALFENRPTALGCEYFILARDTKSGLLVGGTAYEFYQRSGLIRISWQRGSEKAPSVGLAMLSSLIPEARRRGAKTIDLITQRNPLGLGNLGFGYIGDGSLTHMSFSLDLQSQPPAQADDY